MERLTLENAINRSRKLAEHLRWKSENTKLETSDENANEVYKNTCIQYANQEEQYAEWFEELKSYKEAEENGLLMKLPVPLGTTVYTLSTIFDCIYDYDCKSDQKWKCKEDIPCEYEKRSYHIKETEFGFVMVHSIGETVFLTREEAEKKLEEMKLC